MLMIAGYGFAFAGNYSSDLDQRQEQSCNRRDLRLAQPHKIDNQPCNGASSLRNAIAETGEHSLLEFGIWFFGSEFFFQDFVHDFAFAMKLTTARAFDEMSVKRVALGI